MMTQSVTLSVPPDWGAVRSRGRAGGRRTTCNCTPATGAATTPWVDVFTPLDDRRDAQPLALPALRQACTVTLVRHGQSTWNAEGRMQGSSDLSELTEKGFAQAEKTRALLQNRTFDALFVSPLRRARQTAATVWSPRSGEPIVLPSLREVDLYSFQGQTKADAKGSPRYVDWSKAPHKFELDGHAPVRELWYRASVAWASILGAVNDSVLPANGASSRTQHVLVVAHNAVNQALIGAAMGWGPDAFRRFEQSNGALTTLALHPGPAPNAPASASIKVINVTGDGWATRAQPGAVVLIAAPEVVSSSVANGSHLRSLAQHLSSAPPVDFAVHTSNEAAMSMLTALRAGGVAFPSKQVDVSACANIVVERAAQSAHSGIAMVIATPSELSRMLNDVMLPESQCTYAFHLKPFGVSVLNPTSAGTHWSVVASVINDTGL